MKQVLAGAIQLLPAPLYSVWLLSLGTERVDGGGSINDKLAHALGFGLLAVLVVVAVRFIWPRLSPMLWGAFSAAAATLVGGLLEIWQHFLPYRSAEWLDFAADAAGALSFGALASSCLARWSLRSGAQAAEGDP
jgi:VanZ family protein